MNIKSIFTNKKNKKKEIKNYYIENNEIEPTIAANVGVTSQEFEDCGIIDKGETDYNEQQDNGSLFKKVFFENQITRASILYHLKLFNIHYHQREFTLYQLRHYKYSDYLRSVLLKLDKTAPLLLDDRSGDITSNHLSLLPRNIKYLEFPSKFNSPIHIDSLSGCRSITSLKFGKNFQHPVPTSEFLPPKLKILSFNAGNFNQVLPVANFTRHSIKTLSMGSNGNKSIESGSIPMGITSLVVGDLYNHKLKPGMFPPSLTSLTLGSTFNSVIKVGSLPNTLTTLIFGSHHTQEIKVGQLPSSLTHLEFGYANNQSLNGNWLPVSLKTLIVGYSFNKKIDVGTLSEVTTPFLEYLDLGHECNHHIEIGSLPDSITRLKFSDNFNCKLEVGTLPLKLKHLNLGECYNEQIQIGLLPNTLIHLKTSSTFNQHIIANSLPLSLECLEFGKLFSKSFRPNEISQLTSLTKLSIGHTNFNEYQLPRSITNLHLLSPLIRNINVNEIPDTIYKLKIDNLCSDLNPCSIPTTNKLTTLEFGPYFNRKIQQNWFSSGSGTNNHFSSLTCIKFGYFFNQPIEPFSIPSTVIHLSFGLRFNQDLREEGVLPKNLQILDLNDSFPKIDISKLPSTITSLSCYNTNQLFLDHLDIDKFHSIIKVLKNPKIIKSHKK